jgi:hypothetical protein
MQRVAHQPWGMIQVGLQSAESLSTTGIPPTFDVFRIATPSKTQNLCLIAALSAGKSMRAKALIFAECRNRVQSIEGYMLHTSSVLGVFLCLHIALSICSSHCEDWLEPLFKDLNVVLTEKELHSRLRAWQTQDSARNGYFT